ncbi:MAG: NUDIX domain-containing protein [Sphingomonadaceae bacterium]
MSRLSTPLLRVAYRLAHLLRHRWRKMRGKPIVGVTMIARDLDGRLLLVRHSYGPDEWTFPAGGPHRGEDYLATAARELMEEVGCRASALRLIGAIEETLSGCPHTSHVVACVTTDAPQPNGHELLEARFFPTHSLPHPLSARADARLALWTERHETRLDSSD